MTTYFQAALAGIVLVASLAVAVAAGAMIETSVRGDQFAGTGTITEAAVTHAKHV